MAKRSLAGTTSTGLGDHVSFDPPGRTITALAYGATGNFRVVAGIDSEHLTEVIASSTFAAAGTTVTSTSLDLISVAQADFVAVATTVDSSVIISVG